VRDAPHDRALQLHHALDALAVSDGFARACPCALEHVVSVRAWATADSAARDACVELMRDAALRRLLPTERMAHHTPKHARALAIACACTTYVVARIRAAAYIIRGWHDFTVAPFVAVPGLRLSATKLRALPQPDSTYRSTVAVAERALGVLS
jgi:hypothetical protein